MSIGKLAFECKKGIRGIKARVIISNALMMNACLVQFIFVGLLTLFTGEISAWANVYATNIKINGSTNNAVLTPGALVNVSYVLNEDATSGIIFQIMRGADVVLRTNLDSGVAGTLRGTNLLTWDGTNSAGTFSEDGIYTVSITAAASGFDSWTKISDDSNPGNQVWDPYGIAVNQNIHSPYYGRVFVGNAMSSIIPDQQNGVYIFNADCSYSDEGGFDQTDYMWFGFMRSPWKMQVAKDDRLYVCDWSSYGTILGFDQIVSNYVVVLNSDNRLTNSADFNSVAVSVNDMETSVWMGDANTNCSLGIVRWNVTPQGMVLEGDTGHVVVAAGVGSDLSEAPWDITVDKQGHIYTIQKIDSTTNLAYRVLRFTPSIDGTPVTNADWKVNGLEGQNSSAEEITNVFKYVYGIAVNSEGTLLAVASRGGSELQNGGVIIMDAISGAIITYINSSAESSYIDVAWDNVGNVYGTQEELWEVYSPPGPNQATTIAVPSIQVVQTLLPPILSLPQGDLEQVQFTLTGQPNMTYVIEASVDLTNWTACATNYSTLPVRNVQLPAPEELVFYRARSLQ